MEEDSFKKASKMIVELQDKNAKLRLGLGKLLKICLNTKMQNESPVWMQQIGFAQQMFDETDPWNKNKIKSEVTLKEDK